MDQKTISKLLLREQKHINFPYYDLVTKHHKTKILKGLWRYFVSGKGKLKPKTIIELLYWIIEYVQSLAGMFSILSVCVCVWSPRGRARDQTGCLVLPH